MNKRFKTCHKRKLKRIAGINEQMKKSASMSCHNYIGECSVLISGADDFYFIGNTVKKYNGLGVVCK